MVRVDGGQLVLSVNPANYEDPAKAELSTAGAFGIAEATVSVDVDVELEGAGDAYLVWSSGDEWIGMGMDTGLLVAASGISDGNAHALLCEDCPAYDPTAHRFWRLRADETDLHFEASADGEEWSPVANPAPLPFPAGYLVLWAECSAPGSIDVQLERLTFDACRP